MKFDSNVASKYRDALEEAVAVILEKGNKQQRNVATLARDTDLLIRFVPLAEINCSGVTGITSFFRANKRIQRGNISLEAAMSEVYIKFSDWTYDVAGQRGCQGTLIHEGLHAYDFARIISSFSRAPDEPENVFDLTLYELEHRAAVISGDYLSRIGAPDYIDDGLQLGLVALDADGKPYTDMNGIKDRMQYAYGLNESAQGTAISKMLGLKPRKKGFNLTKFLGF